MMKFLAFYLTLTITALLNISAQNDPAAVSILDRFSATALSAPSVSMTFDLVTDNQAEGYKSSVPGSVIISKNKYRLDLKDNIIWYNGKTSWNFLPVEKEVTITEPDRDDNSFMNRPSDIFTMYRNGFKIRLVNENSGVSVIDLYPEDITSDYIRVRLTIDKPALNLKKLEYKNKTGLTVTLDIKEYDLKKQPEASSFVFNNALYKGVEVIDLR